MPKWLTVYILIHAYAYEIVSYTIILADIRLNIEYFLRICTDHFLTKKITTNHDVMRETIIELFMCNGQKEREKKDKKKEIKSIKNS